MLYWKKFEGFGNTRLLTSRSESAVVSMWGAILVDDEELSLFLLSKLIEQYSNIRILGTYTDSREAVGNIVKLKPDVIFIDIDMPGMNGLELAAQLIEWNFEPEIIYITAYSDYALQAFKVNALDYLLKPINPKELSACMKKLDKRLRGNTPRERTADSGIVCFGAFQVYGGKQPEPIRFPTAKVEELFAYLVAHRHAPSSKWTICERLWPNRQPEKAEQNLHTSIFRLKKTLSDFGIRFRLESHRGSYRLHLSEVCDYMNFDDTLPDPAANQEADASTADMLEPVVRLYKGHLFEGKDYEWSLGESERLRRKFTYWALHIGKELLDRQEHMRAADLLRHLLQHSPYEEEGHRLLLQTLLAIGDRTAFLEHYGTFRQLFMSELGLKPDEEIEQLYRIVVAGM